MAKAMASGTAFNSLPIETSQQIASLLEFDLDICRFRAICRATYHAVDSDNQSFWRRRFLEQFDPPLNTKKHSSNLEFRVSYQRRVKGLKRGAVFKVGNTKRETGSLDLLKELVHDSLVLSAGNATASSKNLIHIKRFASVHNILHVVCVPENARKRSSPRISTPSPTTLLQTMQVIMAPIMISISRQLEQHYYGFADSQFAAYSTTIDHPLFNQYTTLEINMTWLLHQVNFWKHHMCGKREQTLLFPFQALDPPERLQFWDAKRSDSTSGSKIGRKWKGSYAYVEDEPLYHIRRHRGECGWVLDRFTGEDTGFVFQDLCLQELPNGESTWPVEFERYLQSLTLPAPQAKTRAQKRNRSPDAKERHDPPLNFRFSGEGSDGKEEFLADGWLNPLPAQQGIPGWQRMTMMKHFEDENGNIIGGDELWAYEGIMLPGGRIILGRWWYPPKGMRQNMYSGPFILWCVDS